MADRTAPWSTDSLLAAVHETRAERIAGGWMLACWGRSETGAWGWLGDRCDDYRVWSWRRRGRAAWRRTCRRTGRASDRGR